MGKENNLSLLRERCGMTQREVAKELGVTRQAVSQWERGAAVPSMEKLLALSRLYGTAAENLLQGEITAKTGDMLSEENCPDRTSRTGWDERIRFDTKQIWLTILVGICALICLWGILCHSVVMAVFLLLSAGNIALVVLIVYNLVKIRQAGNP